VALEWWGFLQALLEVSAPLKCISGVWSGNPARCDKISIVYAFRMKQIVLLQKQLLTNLTSNQVGLPAELKHINKRRKRN
jgi:hypothetical protein